MESTESDDASKMRSLEMSEIGTILGPGQTPVTTEELIDQFGHYEVEYPKGSESLESILRTSGMETYETSDEIELAILNGVRRDAVGRPRYSDRSDERTEELDRPHQSI